MYKITIETDNGSGEIKEISAKNKDEIIHILSDHIIHTLGDYVQINGECGWDFNRK